MKAIRYHELGAPEVLRYEDVDQPSVGAGQVLIKVGAVGVNYVDASRRSGHAPLPPGQSLPMIPGVESAGTVEAVGNGVSEYKPGDRVISRAPYAYAEYLISPTNLVYRAPQSLDLTQAATVITMYTTAWSCLADRGKLQRGETVLIQACASGVGIALVQIAKYLGATVIGTASTDEKLEWAKQHGVDHGINYEKLDFVDEVRKLTDGKGVPIIVDGVGDEVFKKGLTALERGGRIVVYGVAAGKRNAEIILPNLWFQSLSIVGAGSTTREQAEDLLGLFDKGQIKPTVDKTWPLAQASEAHRYLEDRQVHGKVALTVG